MPVLFDEDFVSDIRKEIERRQEAKDVWMAILWISLSMATFYIGYLAGLLK